ncbi:MAG TPA: hypothetical protein VG603_13375 [Chitinophagales bacterium]|nr:hypothetical protein [Chitinophagales bacterium]
MQQNPAIVVVAYNRPHCLSRLLAALKNAVYPGVEVPLVISIDKADNSNVAGLAQKFNWMHGEKTIIAHSQHLGLKKHVLYGGGLSAEYGAVILLEDDVLVSPKFYGYAQKALAFYENENQVAGISLYSYHVSENNFYPFRAVNDGSDVYFLQAAASWGQVFTAAQWSGFSDWLAENDVPELPAYVPGYLKNWSASSWKKHFTHYLIKTGKYFVYPQQALSTNFGDEGENTDRKSLFQVPLLHIEKDFRFVKPEASHSVYDAWFEITPASLNHFVPTLKQFEYTVDLHGTKNFGDITTPMVLSCQNCHNPVLSFGNEMFPAEENIFSQCPGAFYSLAAKENFKTGGGPPLAVFYTGLNSIRDLAFKPYLDKVFEDKKFPVFLINIIYNGNDKALQQTLLSVFEQRYPVLRTRVLVYHSLGTPPKITADTGVELVSCDNDENFLPQLFEKLNAVDYEYATALHAGDLLLSHAFENAHEVFSRFNQINWFTGAAPAIPQNQAVACRWNQRLFELAVKTGKRQIVPSGTFWRKNLWRISAGKEISVPETFSWNTLWQHFFAFAPLYTSEMVFARPARPVGNQLLEPVLWNRLTEWFFVNNITYLRKLYYMQNNFPALIKYESQTQSHYLADY